MEVNVGGALPPARGDLDDLVTSLVHEGARWAAPRTARRAVFGLGVARRATWFRHAAPIVTRGRHAFTEARKSTRIVAGAAATIRGRDHPVAREWDATLVDSVRRLVRPHAPIVIPALRLMSNTEISSVIEDAQNAFGTAICPPGRKRASASDMYALGGAQRICRSAISCCRSWACPAHRD